MREIHARLSALEESRDGQGPLVVPWFLGDDRRAITALGDQEYVQADDESLQQFLDRVSSTTKRPLVWCNEQDMNL
jgi:hypothetical protein